MEDQQEDQEPTTGRCNFKLPIETFRIMQELASTLGIQSVSGAARHFCLTGIQRSMPELSARLVALQQIKTNESIAVQNELLQSMVTMVQEEARGAAASNLDTMGISRDQKREAKKKG